VRFVCPRELVLLMKNKGKAWQCTVLRSTSPQPQPAFAGRKILDLGLPSEDLGIYNPEEVRFAITAY
jgi:hypothetical protein